MLSAASWNRGRACGFDLHDLPLLRRQCRAMELVVAQRDKIAWAGVRETHTIHNQRLVAGLVLLTVNNGGSLQGEVVTVASGPDGRRCRSTVVSRERTSTESDYLIGRMLSAPLAAREFPPPTRNSAKRAGLCLARHLSTTSLPRLISMKTPLAVSDAGAKKAQSIPGQERV